MTTGPIQSSYNPEEIRRINEEIEKIKNDADQGIVNPSDIMHFQKDLLKLLDDPNVPSPMKEHIQKLMQDFAQDPTHVNAPDLFKVQLDLNNLPK